MELLHKVSVIIPTYKRSDRLIKAIDSVLEQTYSNIEVIVVDDNDSDSDYRLETQKKMQKYINDKRVIYIKHSHNLNGAAARNTGLKNSNGEFICFLDDDDMFKKDKIEKQLEYLLNNKYEAVYCGRIKGNKEIKYNLEGDLSKELLLLEFSPTSSTLMFTKKSLIEINGFDESYKRHQDFELLLRFFEKKNKIGVVNDVLVITGINSGENQLIGKDLEKMKLNFLNQFDSVINRLDKNDDGLKKNIYIRHYASIFISYIKDKNIMQCLRIYVKMIFKYPYSFNYYLLKRIIKNAK